MAKDKLEDWDEVAANNLDMGGISLAENVMRPPAVNNEMREHMAQVSKWLGDDTVVAAATTDIGALPGRYISVTGNTAITSFGTIKAGTIKYLRFTGTPTLAYNVTSMILPVPYSIVAAPGDTAIVVSEGSGNWRCINYQRASNTPIGSEQWAEGAPIVSASTLVLGTDGNMFHVTGTTSIGAIGGAAGFPSPVTLVFEAATPIVNSTSLILPGAATLITAPGDVAVFVWEGGAVWRCVSYRRGGDLITALDGAAKFWVTVNVTAGTPSIAASYNVTSITDTGPGQLTVTIGTDFSSANWACSASVGGGAASVFANVIGKSAGTVLVAAISLADAFSDPARYEIMGFGAQ